MNRRKINIGKNRQAAESKIRDAIVLLSVMGALWISFTGRTAWGQVDQGAITGVVQDATGAVVPGAQVALTDTDTGLVLEGKANGSGNYVFSPVKQGNYSLSATAAGFQTTVQQNIHVDIELGEPLHHERQLEWRSDYCAGFVSKRQARRQILSASS